MPTVFFTSASGNIGDSAVEQLLHDEYNRVILPTSNSSKLINKYENRPGYDRVSIEEGDISDPLWVDGLLRQHKVDSLFINLVGERELIISLNLLDCARKAQISQIILLSIAGDLQALPPSLCQHMAVKKLLEEQVAHDRGHYRWTFLGPTLFFTNDERDVILKHVLEGGAYRQPHGAGCSRVDVADIAYVIKKVVKDPNLYHARKIDIGSRKAYTDDDVELIWSKAVGRSVKALRPTPQGLQSMEELWRGQVSPIWGRDMRLMYEEFRDHPFTVSEQAYSELVEVLGREPARYEDFVDRIVAKRLP
ncbi:hypothetical protein BCR39DRAFT_555426 [Naematelia encephala]|uniref:NmrA-like domain-containing protein n=1 Tax=Naematelia encephala TaxID=71784 RepID=A0A1Y2ACE0_9TREE|nr:hypothetical protein BCR39DRAFT_555426 [Naematelia encephala]